MKFLLLILAIFMALAASCPPPFNNARFAGNNSAELIRTEMEGNGLGWSEVVTHYSSPLKPWPRGEDGIVRIKYCFEDEEAQRFSGLLILSWKKWSDKIGAPSQESGHRLTFEEFKFDDKVSHKYCYEEQTDPNAPKKWNFAAGLPGETVVITRPDNPYDVKSITGYRPPNWDSEPGRHRIWVGDAMENIGEGAVYLAHEIGHVVGLWHEHSREDRDHYVHFECENVLGYRQAKEIVDKEGKHTMEEVCTSSTLGYFYNFAAPQWSTEDGEEQRGVFVDHFARVDGADYDINSIMHYFSSCFWIPDRDKNDVTQVPLVKWKHSTGKDYVPPDQVTHDNAEIIQINILPSDQDREAIKHIYPW